MVGNRQVWQTQPERTICLAACSENATLPRRTQQDQRRQQAGKQHRSAPIVIRYLSDNQQGAQEARSDGRLCGVDASPPPVQARLSDGVGRWSATTLRSAWEEISHIAGGASSPLQFRQSPNCCPREAGWDDRFTLLQAVSPCNTTSGNGSQAPITTKHKIRCSALVCGRGWPAPPSVANLDHEARAAPSTRRQSRSALMQSSATVCHLWR